MEGKEAMKRAAEGLGEVVRVVEYGEAGKKVILPIRNASLALRIPQETLRRMGYKSQGLEIGVKGNSVEIILRGSEASRRQAYLFLYSFVQNLDHPAVLKEILAEREIPRELLSAIEDFAETVAVAKKGVLPDEDVRFLALATYSLFHSLKNRSDLPNPLKVLGNKY